MKNHDLLAAQPHYKPRKSFGFILCVYLCMVWDEMQRLGLVLVVYDGMNLNTRAWVKQWLWGFGWWFFPWYLPFSLAYFSCDSNAYVPIFEKLHVCEKQLIEAFHDIQFIWLNSSLKQTPFLSDHCILSLEDKWTVLSLLEDKQNCKFGGVC